MKKRVLIFGATGLVGQELVKRFLPIYELITPSSKECNLSQPSAVKYIIENLKPDLVINAAATANVDDAELNPTKAIIINADAPEAMAFGCIKHYSSFIHISSDYVFDGESNIAYTESAMRNPVSKYGESKALAEVKLESFKQKNPNARILIFRTSWVFGRGRDTFPEVIMRNAATSASPINVVDDQWGSPTLSLDLANCLFMAANEFLSEKAMTLSTPVGLPLIMHFSNRGRCSRYKFAKVIFEKAKAISNFDFLDSDRVNPVKTIEFLRPAKRPVMSELNTELFEKLFSQTPRSWESALDEHLIQLSEKGFFNQLATKNREVSK